MRRAHQVLQALGLALKVNQVQYNPFDRSTEKNGALDAAKEPGVMIIACTPLVSGWLTGKCHRQPELMRAESWRWRAKLQRDLAKSRALVVELLDLGGERQVAAAQVALNWLINGHGETDAAVPDATNVHHAKESADATRFKLADGDISRLSELSLF